MKEPVELTRFGRCIFLMMISQQNAKAIGNFRLTPHFSMLNRVRHSKSYGCSINDAAKMFNEEASYLLTQGISKNLNQNLQLMMKPDRNYGCGIWANCPKTLESKSDCHLVELIGQVKVVSNKNKSQEFLCTESNFI